MCAHFDDVPCFKNDDLICLKDCVEAMGDGDHGPSLHEAARGFFEQGFGFRVEAGGGFIEDEDGCIF